MNIKVIKGLLIMVILMFSVTACQAHADNLEEKTSNDSHLSDDSNVSDDVGQSSDGLVPQHSTGHIYLYGEAHGVKVIYDEELKAWQTHYKEGVRDLLIEMPSYTAAYLNEWMKAEDDTILDRIYGDWSGNLSNTEDTYAFYKAIKETCPDTVFHGTDVGHQGETFGKFYLKHLKLQGYDENSEPYQETTKVIEQGKRYYGSTPNDEDNDNDYRENMMTQNFVQAFDRLEGKDVMGIYGSAHTNLNATSAYSDSLPCMANQLNAIYKGQITSTDLSVLVNSLGEPYITDPQSIETITIDGKDYVASYFGSHEIDFLETYKSRKFWRIENAYPDLTDNQTTGDVLPYDNYPCQVKEGQVFMIEYTLADGSTETYFYRSDAGATYRDMPASIGFDLDDFSMQGDQNLSNHLNNPSTQGNQGMIYLYGEIHRKKDVMAEELRLWKMYYNTLGMRDLFVEYSEASAYFLNQWMKSGDDTILEQLFEDDELSPDEIELVYTFYQKIKEECPETVFHGTDVAHRFSKTSKRALEELQSQGLKGTSIYQAILENSDQGEHYYLSHDGSYREKMMIQNFNKAFDKIGQKSVMGIYGEAHTNLWHTSASGEDNMGRAIKKHYGEKVISTDLTYLYEDPDLLEEPLSTQWMRINDKAYLASYFGEKALNNDTYEYWRLEDAYEDFKEKPITGDYMNVKGYPFKVTVGQVFRVKVTHYDGSAQVLYLRSDGRQYNGYNVIDVFSMDD